MDLASGIILQMGLGFLSDWVLKAVNAFNSLLLDATEGLLRVLNNLIIETPYPGSEGGEGPILFGRPESELWGALYDMYVSSADIAIVLLAILLIVAHALRVFEAEFSEGWDAGTTSNKIIKAMILAKFWWPIGVAILAFSDLLAEAVVALTSNVNAEEAEPGLVAAFEQIRDQATLDGGDEGAFELLALNLALLIPFIIQLGVMLILLILWMLRYIIIFLIMPLMPLMFVIWAFDFPFVDTLSNIGGKTIKTFISIVFISFPAALIVAVFVQLTGTISQIVNNEVFSPSNMADGGSAAMTLADGAASTGAVGNTGATLVGVIIGALFVIIFPLIAAGGPFLLMGSNNLSIKDGIKAHPLGAAFSKAQSARDRGVGGYRNVFGGEGEAVGGGGGGGGSGEGSGETSGAPGESSEDAPVNESGSSGPQNNSRFGRIKNRISGTYRDAQNIMDAPASEQAAMGLSGMSSGASLMSQKTKGAAKTGGKYAQLGKTQTWRGAAKTAHKNASNKIKNSISEERFKARKIKNEVGESVTTSRAKIGKAIGDRKRRYKAMDEADSLEEAAEIGGIDSTERVTADDIEDDMAKGLHGILEVAGLQDEFENSDVPLDTFIEQKKNNGEIPPIAESEIPNAETARALGLPRPERFDKDWQPQVSAESVEEVLEHNPLEFDDEADLYSHWKGNDELKEKFDHDMDAWIRSFDRPATEDEMAPPPKSVQEAKVRYEEENVYEAARRMGHDPTSDKFDMDAFLEKEFVGNHNRGGNNILQAVENDDLTAASRGQFESVEEAKAAYGDRIDAFLEQNNIDPESEEFDKDQFFKDTLVQQKISPDKVGQAAMDEIVRVKQERGAVPGEQYDVRDATDAAVRSFDAAEERGSEFVRGALETHQERMSPYQTMDNSGMESQINEDVTEEDTDRVPNNEGQTTTSEGQSRAAEQQARTSE